MAEIKCPECGALVWDDQFACAECGTALRNANPRGDESSLQPIRPTEFPPLTVGVVVVFVLALALLVVREVLLASR